VRRLLATLTLVLVAAAPAVASAATRYASPSGTGDCSTPEQACSATTAIGAAPAGSEVILAPGDYSIPAEIPVTNVNVVIHGQDGAPRPRLIAPGNGGYRILNLTAGGDVARHIDFSSEDPGNAALQVAGGALVEDATVRCHSSAGCLVLFNGTARDVLAVSSQNLAVFVYGTTASTLRNVTAINTSPAGGAISAGSGPAAHTLVNVVANAVGGGSDLSASGGSTFTAFHSAFRLGHSSDYTNGDSGNVSSDPVFVNGPGGDFHEYSTSPLIDAGVTGSDNGSVDLDGNPRTLGSAPDIGAYEFLPAPAATTGAASAIGATGATISGSADPRGLSGTASFEFGADTAYGQTTAAQAVPGAPSAATAALTGLAPNTTYHYRLVVTTGGGTVRGADGSFTTLATPPGGAGGLKATLKLAKSKLATALRKGLKATATCSGVCRLKLVAQLDGKTARKLKLTKLSSAVTVGSGGATLLKAGTASLKVRFAKAAQKVLKKQRKVRLTFVLTATDPDGKAVKVTRVLALKR
jgi:hypothetical protein